VEVVNAEDRTCVVKWLSPLTFDVEKTEEVSMYTIQDHPDFTFRLGEIVLKYESVSDSVTDDLTSSKKKKKKKDHAWLGEVLGYEGTDSIISYCSI